jgi:hypothetical protein
VKRFNAALIAALLIIKINNQKMSKLELEGSLLNIPEERTPEICLELAMLDGRVIKFFSDFELTQEVCLTAVTNTGYAIQYLSDQHRTSEVCLAAVESNGSVIDFLSVEQRSPAICVAAVKQSPQALYYLKDEERNFDTLYAAVSANGFAFDILEPHEKTFAICLAAVKRRGGALDLVPTEVINSDICLAAVTEDGLALEFVPDFLRTTEICLVAIKRNVRALRFVGDESELLMTSIDEARRNGTPSYNASSYLTPNQLLIYHKEISKKEFEDQKKQSERIKADKKWNLTQRYLLCLAVLIGAYMARNNEYFSMFLIGIAALMAWEFSLALLLLGILGLAVWALFLMPISVAVVIGAAIIATAIYFKKK